MAPYISNTLFVLLMVAWAIMTVFVVAGWLKKADIRARFNREVLRIEGLKWLDSMIVLMESSTTTDSLLDVRTKLSKWKEHCILEQSIEVLRLFEKIDHKLDKISK